MKPMLVAGNGLSASFMASLVASLPVSLAQGEGDVVLLQGAGDWPARLMTTLAQGAKRIILLDPAPVPELGPVIEQVEAAGALLLLCETHSDNPAVAPFAAGLQPVFSTVTVEAQGEDDLASLLLAQIRVARGMGMTMGELLNATAGQDQALAMLAARLRGQEVLLRLGAVRCRAGLARLRWMAHGPTDSACLELDSSGKPRPVVAWHVNGDGMRNMPSLYENALRSILRKAVAGAWPADTQALRDWASDAALALAIAQG
ncbi:hypothetical protein EOE18_06915 [Novosphingobium umbonatum]|uniref:Uncharacterized protein n=1 Tax=Novosphingobium umbonatum TaxID=1908524 RepID=A0A437N714_9SPHN|nr:hypothetical protein [Novosphingobium umbonatum]RVU05714.1 hypothetical protein EOE18_06915 [Novosphingobium umbonatum]